MAKNRTEEDWFLRGGERPPKPEQLPPPPAEIKICEICGGSNIGEEEYCTHCGTPLDRTPDSEDDETGDDDDELRKFRVRVTASQPVETFVIVTATNEEDACDKVAGILDDGEFNPEAQDWDPVGSVDDPEIDDTDVTEV
jgi:hypothetical protein